MGPLIVRPADPVKNTEKFTWKMIEKRKQDAFNDKVKVFIDASGGFLSLEMVLLMWQVTSAAISPRDQIIARAFVQT